MILQLAASLSGHKSAIYALSAGSFPHSCFSADGNGWIVYWANMLLNEGVAIAQVPANVFSLHYLEQQHTMAAGSMQGIVYGIDLKHPALLPKAIQLPPPVFALQTYQNILLAGAGDGRLYAIATDTWQAVRALPLSDSAIRDIALHPTAPLAAVACSDAMIYIIDLEKWILVQTLLFHQQSVFSVCFSPNGQYLFSGSRDAYLAIWQTAGDFALHHTIPAHLSTINSIVCSPNMPYFATAARDKTLKIWNLHTFALEKVIDPAKPNIRSHQYSVNRLLWLCDDKPYLLSAGDDKMILVWHITPTAVQCQTI